MVLQKLFYDEMNAPSIDFEEQEKKRQEELLSHFIKLKTTRECQKVCLNELKINAAWRIILREARSQELRKDIDAMREAFQMSLEHKSKMILFLTRELDEIKMQQLWNVNFHMNNLRELLEIKQETAQSIRANYLNDLAELKNQFIEEERMAMQNHQEKLTELNELMYNTDKSYFGKMQDAYSIHNLRMDAVKYMGNQNRVAMQHKFESQVDYLWTQLQAVFHSYAENTSKRSKRFLELKKKHNETTDLIKQKQEDLDTLVKKVSILKQKIEKAKKERAQKTECLEKERKLLLACKLELQMQAREKQELARTQLVVLVTESRRTIKELEKRKVKGFNVLKIAKWCKQFEADCDDEDIHKFYFTQKVQEVLKNELCALKNESFQEDKECHSLDNFWIRHSKIVIQTFALKRELMDLQTKNEKLKSEVRKKLMDVSS